ncbi:hypothetical protein Patl1_18668 [Pistacia atlantica]|uniref:Uncharacterized protein n=1 Tax=Pistacia atlantica TaxID=434234 RepID=A0ACC1C1V3_9ROSI|nr:hypothetical protein Patl1_18668 [Pistacia atlantica]
MKNEDQARSLFGISLSDRPKWHQFLICSSGFFFGYLVNGVCEMEMLFCSTVVGLPFLLAPMILTGELFRAWNSCSQVKNSMPFSKFSFTFFFLEEVISV